MPRCPVVELCASVGQKVYRSADHTIEQTVDGLLDLVQ